MNRAKLGSIIFFGGLLLVCGAERNDAYADAPVTTTPAQAVESKSAAVGSDHSVHGTQGSDAVPANAGLKAIAAPEIGVTGACGEGMLEVEGEYCAEVEQKCTKYIDPEGVFPRRCAEFERSSKCTGKTTKKHFCIDKFEYPNKPGENPVVMKTWYDARDACAANGKRLCGDSEWTLACEGSERLPYPYGYDRNSEACNIDKPHPDVNEKALGSNDPKVRDAEAKRLWQGEPSGSRNSCVSPYGVMDMTGNVDEWVVNESGVPYKSGLKGGYWGPVRDRCRPETTVHAEGFSFYQIGFRCCGDVPTSPNTTVKPSGAPSGNGSPTTAPVNKTNPAPTSSVGS